MNNSKLVRRLGAKFVWLEIGAFILIDIMVAILVFIGGIYYADQTAFQAITAVRDAEFGTVYFESADRKESIELGSVRIEYPDTLPNSILFNKPAQELSPEDMKDGIRSLDYDMTGSSQFEKLKSARYEVSVPLSAGGFLTASVGIGSFLAASRFIFIILLVLELLTITGNGISARKSIRTTLEPLRELRAATEAFTDAARSPSGRYPPEALKNLARALDDVNASHLDRRISSDILTEELQPLARAINEMLNRIDESYNAQIRFVSDASHELRTPIAVIQGYANLLSRWGSDDPETLDESIEAIKTEADSMKQMVNQLLFLARGDSESMKLIWETIDLSLIAGEIIKEEEMIDGAHTYNADLMKKVYIKGDAGLIKQLFRILTDNSIKYTPADGQITIKVDKEPVAAGTMSELYKYGSARFIIRDEGVGIPADILPHIFDRFVRADESRTRNTGGAGLGLSIAKWIAEKHLGYLEVVSSEGIGTKFTVVLPLALAPSN